MLEPHNEDFCDFDKVEELISKLSQEVTDELILVGGQALSVWGRYYLIDELTGEQFIDLSSHDVDFVARQPAIKHCAEAWGGHPVYPGMDDSTPSTGIITITSDHEDDIAIDFIDKVYGVENKDLKKYCDKIPAGNNDIPILSPALCLKSRISNAVGLNYGPDKLKREITRIEIAVRATSYYIEDRLLMGGERKRDALKIAHYLMHAVILHQDGIKIMLQHNIDLTLALNIEHPGWPIEFREIEWPKRVAQLKDKMEKGVRQLEFSRERAERKQVLASPRP